MLHIPLDTRCFYCSSVSHSTRYEALLLEEQSVAQEIAAFGRKLDSWQSIPRAEHLKADAAVGPGGVAGLAESSSSSMPPAVIAFEVRLKC